MSEDLPTQLAGLRIGSALAGYRLEAQIGVGGMALVFRAHDERLDRVVALKILAPGLAADMPFRRRFIAESRAAAAVDNPHIVPVYEAGEARGVLYIAMRFVKGGDLRLVLEQEGALAPTRAVTFISPVASALDSAHDIGLVHRDVKPANILVDTSPDRPDHVYLSDFGVSKWAVSSVSQPGQFVGTPDYSAPEQIQGRVVNGRTDQYALACVAYELLTGSVPFERDQGMAVLLSHLSEPPPSLSSRRSGLPGAVDQVLAKALAKTPEKRYTSCREFADTLREALDCAPYNPRILPSGPGHPQFKIAEQKSGLSELVAGALRKDDVQTDPALAATIDPMIKDGMADAAGLPPAPVSESAPQRAVTTAVNRGPHAQPPSTPKRPLGRRILAAGIASGVLLAGAIFVLNRQTTFPVPPGHPEAIFHHSGVSYFPGVTEAFSPNSKSLAIGYCTVDNTFDCTEGSGTHTDLWNVATGRVTATFTNPGTHHGVPVVAFSPDGKTLATGDTGYTYGSTYLWNVATGKITARLTHPGTAYSATAIGFSLDGKTLAVGDADGDAYLWNTGTGRITATITYPGTSVDALAFSPDGKTLAIGDDNTGVSSIYLWNTSARKITATLTEPPIKFWTSPVMAFSPDGKTLAVSYIGASTYLWNTATHMIAAVFTDPMKDHNVQALAFSPDGKTLAVGEMDSSYTPSKGTGRTYLWNVTTGKIIAKLTDPGMDSEVDTVTFSPDGKALAASGSNGSTYLWNMNWLTS